MSNDPEILEKNTISFKLRQHKNGKNILFLMGRNAVL